MPAKSCPKKRLLSKYDVDEKSGCWNWNASFMNSGYGQIKVNKKTLGAHRFSYTCHYGDIPPGLHVLHICDNKRCINPKHLKLGTHAENIKQASERGLMKKGKNHPNFGKPREYEYYKNQLKPVIVDGVYYRGVREAERELGLSHGTLRYWIDNKPQKAQLIEKGENYDNSK